MYSHSRIDVKHPRKSEGLSTDDAERILRQDGRNVLTPPRKDSILVQILKQFTDPFLVLLILVRRPPVQQRRVLVADHGADGGAALGRLHRVAAQVDRLFAAQEREKPNGERLPGYTDSALPLKAGINSSEIKMMFFIEILH